METPSQYFVFTIDGQHYAISLFAVEEVVQAVELIPLPNASEMLTGLINVKGKIISVVNIRKKFHLPDRETDLNDRIIISRASTRTLAFMVDKVEGLAEFPQGQVDETLQIFLEKECIEGVGRFGGNTVLLFDIDKLFPDRDIDRLDKVIKEQN